MKPGGRMQSVKVRVELLYFGADPNQGADVFPLSLTLRLGVFHYFPKFPRQ